MAWGERVYPELFKVGPFTVYTYGVLLAASYLLGLRLAMWRAKKWGLDPNRVLDLGIYIIIAALVGAKLLLLVVDFDQFKDPRELLNLARLGGVFYGGLLLALAVAFWYIARHRMPFWTTCDVFAPGIALGHVTGRLGIHDTPSRVNDFETSFLILFVLGLCVRQFVARDNTAGILAISTTLFGLMYVPWLLNFARSPP